MSEMFEGILVFESDEAMQMAVRQLEGHGLLGQGFRYAVNYDQKLVVLPKGEYPGLNELKSSLFELACPTKSHLDGLVLDDEVHLISWDVHTQSFFELDGLEVAQMFDDQEDKQYFELAEDALDDVSEQAFLERREQLAKKAYERLPGFLESRRVDEFFKDKGY